MQQHGRVREKISTMDIKRNLKVAGRETSQKTNYHSKGSADTFPDFNKDTGVVEQLEVA